jgi:hypothetical protein
MTGDKRKTTGKLALKSQLGALQTIRKEIATYSRKPVSSSTPAVASIRPVQRLPGVIALATLVCLIGFQRSLRSAAPHDGP